MNIKITQANDSKIRAALVKVNGNASQHCYSTYGDLWEIAGRAELKLLKLVLFKKSAPGAEYCSTSGSAVPNAYKYTRKATRVTIIRRSTGWFLTEVQTTKIYKDGGREYLILTAKQDADAVKMFRALYEVKQEVAA